MFIRSAGVFFGRGQVTYQAFLKNLNARGMFRIRPNLDQIRKVLLALGNPQDRYPTIHIAGTNGKGSVAAALESVRRMENVADPLRDCAVTVYEFVVAVATPTVPSATGAPSTSGSPISENFNSASTSRSGRRSSGAKSSRATISKASANGSNLAPSIDKPPAYS